jgi:hypothetical protein
VALPVVPVNMAIGAPQAAVLLVIGSAEHGPTIE